MAEERIQKIMSEQGLCSRRAAEQIIAEGRVKVNGHPVKVGDKMDPNRDVLHVDDERIYIQKNQQMYYLALYKPRGYVTTASDELGRKTVMELVKDACTERIYPVGRLDKNSVGLLLFTNDGDLTRQLTHPSFQKKKIYQVSLDKPLTKADMEQIAQGITLEDGEIYADEIAYVKEDKTEVGIEIHSGRNRIVRRIFEHMGYAVKKLDRVYYAGLSKKNLKRGQWRFLTREEVQRLKSGQYE
jgi:23S rRNA pseudouridine2605 synthase